MVRVTGGLRTKQRHKAVLKLASGYKMARHKRFKAAQEAVLHAGEYAFAGRKLRKRDFRATWILRINAALREQGTSYSTFVHKLKGSNIALDRKVLAYFATEKPSVFKRIVSHVQGRQSSSKQ